VSKKKMAREYQNAECLLRVFPVRVKTDKCSVSCCSLHFFSSHYNKSSTWIIHDTRHWLYLNAALLLLEVKKVIDKYKQKKAESKPVSNQMIENLKIVNAVVEMGTP
jgi:hypothetical protein